jgi:tripartite-type tricarboxylate transporter receptor subunit TctC
MNSRVSRALCARLISMKGGKAITLAARFLATLGLFAAVATAAAQPWPSKPVRLVIPFAPGGGADFAGRLIAHELSTGLGQSFVVENPTGAGGTIGSAAVAKSSPDGYSVVLANVGVVSILPHLLKKLPFDPQKDLAPVTLVVNSLSVLVVHPDLPVRNVRELIAHAKANPGKLSFGSAGAGTDTHLAGELFKSMTGTQMVHVAYKGGAPAILDLTAGRVELSFMSVASTISWIKSGKLRALAMTGTKRFELLPELPTMAEAGVPAYAINNWYGLFVPVGTPGDIVRRLQAEAARAVQKPDVRAKLIAAGLEPALNTPEEFAAYIKSENAKWSKIVRDSGATAD